MEATTTQETAADLGSLGEGIYNDTWNAAQLIDRNGHHIRYVKGWGWLVYDGKRWERDADDAVVELVKETITAEFALVGEMKDSGDRKRLTLHLSRSLDYRRLVDAANAARSDRRVRMRPEQFDQRPWLFNCQNGTLDLQSGQLFDHDPKDYITQVAACDYDPDAQSDEWERFMDWVTVGRADLREYIQRALGYALTGLTREKAFWFAYGPQGDNGKTTLLEAVLHAVGDYGCSVGVETLLGGREGSVSNDLAALNGKRFAIASEPDEGKTFRVGRLKQLTGSDTIKARFLNREFFEYKPVLKLWIAANNRPAVPESGDATWERFKVVPFDNHVSKADRDGALGERLRKAAPAILAWLVQGCQTWQEAGGLAEPECMRAETADYRAAEDPFSAWLADECDVSDPNAWTDTKDTLLPAFRRFCDEGGYMIGARRPGELTATQFHTLAKKQGLTVRARNTGRGLMGVRLKTADGTTTGGMSPLEFYRVHLTATPRRYDDGTPDGWDDSI
jgi:putative DNA primase/helicase